MQEYICQTCGKVFKDRKRPDRIIKFCSHRCYAVSKIGKVSWNKGIPCRKETKQKLSKALKGKRRSPSTEFSRQNHSGDKNQRWNGGHYISSQGYVMILQPYHPRKLATGYVAEQILVAEEYLKRFLTPDEVVHHINRDKKDNRPENLFLFENNAEHARHHMRLLHGQEDEKNSNLV